MSSRIELGPNGRDRARAKGNGALDRVRRLLQALVKPHRAASSDERGKCRSDGDGLS